MTDALQMEIPKKEFPIFMDKPFDINGDFVDIPEHWSMKVATYQEMKELENLGFFSEPDTRITLRSSLATRMVDTCVSSFDVVLDASLRKYSDPKAPTIQITPVLTVRTHGVKFRTKAHPTPEYLCDSAVNLRATLMKRFENYEITPENGWDFMLRMDLYTSQKRSWSETEIMLIDELVSQKKSLTVVAQLLTSGLKIRDIASVMDAPVSYLKTAFANI